MWIANGFKTVSKSVSMKWQPVFLESSRKNKKYMVISPKGKWVHFGQKSAQQFKDTTGLGLYSHLDHGDNERRRLYLARASGIKNKQGLRTLNDKESSNFYSMRYLW